jgi:hypothetical protein
MVGIHISEEEGEVSRIGVVVFVGCMEKEVSLIPETREVQRGLGHHCVLIQFSKYPFEMH